MGQRAHKPSASPTPHKRVHYDIENENRNMRFRSKVKNRSVKVVNIDLLIITNRALSPHPIMVKEWIVITE